MNGKAKRVLQVSATFQTGGIETFIMKIYRSIDREKVQFDFLFYGDGVGKYEDEITALGGRIFRLPNKRENLWKFVKGTYLLVKENRYEIIHRHGFTHSLALDALIMKLAGCKHLIVHSHNTRSEEIEDSWVRKVSMRPCRWLLNKAADYRFSCSEAAGRWLFGERWQCRVIPVAIDLDKFQFRPELRDKIRERYHWENQLLLGSVGRLERQKNYLFLLDVFLECHNLDNSARLVIVGEGSQRTQIKQKIDSLKINDLVSLMGAQDNVDELMQGLDLLVMPSLYEGLPSAAVEAQAEGLPCILSSNITKEVDLTGISFCELSLGAQEWARRILKMTREHIRKNNAELVAQKGFDIDVMAEELKTFYLKLS